MPRGMETSLHRFRVSRISNNDQPTTPSTSTLPERRRSGSSDAGRSNPAPGPAHSDKAEPKAKTIPACDRCRSFKKKCSRTFPVCSLCAHAGQKCSYSIPQSSSTAQLHLLRTRVQWLSSHINRVLPSSVNVEGIETGTDLRPFLSNSTFETSDTRQEQPSPISVVTSNQDAQAGHDFKAPDGSYEDNPTARQSHPLSDAQLTSAGDLSGSTALDKQRMSSTLPPDAVARQFVDAYFRNVNRAYPFVNRTKILTDLEFFGGFVQQRRNTDSTLLYLIMAIGCTTLQRAGVIPADTASSNFEIPYSDIIQECLCREDIESVQILVLLALYSLFDPKGTSTWSIVGIVSRQAMLLGLTRRDLHEKGLSAIEIELRRRLFWSIYVLDRMMASSLGMTPALTDNNTDVPLPGLTLEEFASTDRTYHTMILQTSRHVIQLRQLEDRILQQVHLGRQSDVNASHAHQTLLKDIRADIENWYSHGCLISPMEPDNVPIHNSITWLGARYYFLLILLYYPSHFSSFEPVISQAELLRFTQKHLQLTSALFQQNQLPLNKVTLCRLFPIGVVIIYSLTNCGREVASFPVRDEVATLVTILDAFAEEWKQAHQAADLFRQLLAVVDTATSDLVALRFPRPSFMNNPVEGARDTQNALRPLLTVLLTLMQDVLGKSSCYRVPDPTEGMVSSLEMSFARQEPLFNPIISNSFLATEAASASADEVEDAMLGCEFGPLELDFL